MKLSQRLIEMALEREHLATAAGMMMARKLSVDAMTLREAANFVEEMDPREKFESLKDAYQLVLYFPNAEQAAEFATIIRAAYPNLKSHPV
jgi:hypothetical protein